MNRRGLFGKIAALFGAAKVAPLMADQAATPISNLSKSWNEASFSMQAAEFLPPGLYRLKDTRILRIREISDNIGTPSEWMWNRESDGLTCGVGDVECARKIQYGPNFLFGVKR